MEEAGGRIGYEIYSGQGDEAVVYSQGYGVVQQTSEAPQIDLAALVGQCGRTLSAAEIYAQFAAVGLNLRPSFRVLKKLHVGEGVAIGVLELASEFRTVGYNWPPNLLDGAVQTSIGILLTSQGGLELPFALQAVEQWAEVPSSAWAVVRTAKRDSGAVRKLDVAIVDRDGRVALQLSGFSTRPLQNMGSGEVSETVLAVAQWKEQALVRPLEKEVAYGAHWVLLCEVDVAPKLVADLAPASCVRLEASGRLEERYGSYAVQLLKQLQGIVESAPRRPVLVQLVVPAREAILQGLSALLRSAQQEYPKLVGQLVAVESLTELALPLKAEAFSAVPVVRYGPAGREVLSFTECERFNSSDVERFNSSDAGSLSRSNAPLPWREGGVYWITGGMGGLGRLFAQAIAQQVKEPVLILSGRRALLPSQESFLEGLRNQGARVDYRVVDVGDRAAMSQLVQGIVAQYGRLNGVIHSAGVLRDRLLVNKSLEELEQVFRPKVAGLVALDEATKASALDWLVLCSSIASIWGNVGQSDYAAANGFMDGYAQHRQGLVEQGLRQGRTVSVSWPLWAEGGM